MKLIFSDFLQPRPRHILQPCQPDSGGCPYLEQSPSGRFDRRFHSSHPGTLSGHRRNGVRLGDRGQVRRLVRINFKKYADSGKIQLLFGNVI